MGTEVLLPSKALPVLVAAKVMLSLYQQPVIIPNGPEEENKNLGFGKNNQRAAPSPPWAEGRPGAAPEQVLLQLLVGLLGDPI